MKITMFVMGFLVATSAAYAAPITLAGDQIDAAMIRTVDNGFGLGRIRGYGLEAPFVVQDGIADKHTYSSAFTLDVDGDKFFVQFVTSSGWQEGIVLRLSDLDFSQSGSFLSSVSVDTNLAGYVLSTGPDTISLGLGGTYFTPGTYFVGTFNTATIPEPTSFALVALGIFGAAIVKTKTIRRNRESNPVGESL